MGARLSRARSSQKEVAMSFKSDFPEYAAIESQIRRAQALRAVYVSHAIVEVATGIWTALRHAFGSGGETPASRKAAARAAHRNFFSRLAPHR
jgi:hypothetical protein